MASKMTAEEQELKAQIDALRAENEALRAKKATAMKLSCKVSDKTGALCLCGLGRFPVTLYADQWERLLENTDMIKAFMKAHDKELSRKGSDNSNTTTATA